MSLFANAIRLRQPGRDFSINLVHAFEAKRVEMISGRKGFNPPETWIFQTTREDDMAVHPILPNDKCREAHPHLKGDPRLFRQDGDRSVSFGEQQQLVENSARGCRLAGKMRGQRITPARMRLIAIGKLTPTIRAAPHRSARAANRHRPRFTGSDKSSGNARGRCGN
jgi:hypothetical protein